MPTPTKGPRLGGGPAHERIMLANLSANLFEHKKITTTVTKAKRLRPFAERLITFAKKGDLASRRKVQGIISAKNRTNKTIVHELFTVIAPAMANREGGYTRITKIGNRHGDNAPMAVIAEEGVQGLAMGLTLEGADRRDRFPSAVPFDPGQVVRLQQRVRELAAVQPSPPPLPPIGTQ